MCSRTSAKTILLSGEVRNEPVAMSNSRARVLKVVTHRWSSGSCLRATNGEFLLDLRPETGDLGYAIFAHDGLCANSLAQLVTVGTDIDRRAHDARVAQG